MKEFWHTKTLFKQWWKYKWSLKYNYCIECKTCDSIHKGRWLCTKCWDKERNKNPKRKLQKYKSHIKHYDYARIFNTKWFRTRIDDILTNYARDKKNQITANLNRKEIWSIKKRIKRRLDKWLPCLKIIINWKIRYLPFEDLIKPKDINLYEEWKEKDKQFKILKKYYDKMQ